MTDPNALADEYLRGVRHGRAAAARFDQCGIDCTTDCGHCKGHPVDAMRDEIARLRTQIRAVLDAQEERDRRVWRAACGFP